MLELLSLTLIPSFVLEIDILVSTPIQLFIRQLRTGQEVFGITYLNCSS